MKIQALLIIGITTSLSYSAERPTQTGLLVRAAKQHARNAPQHHLIQNSLNDVAANTAERELQRKLLHRLTLNAETSEIASKEHALEQLQERRRSTMSALDLQLRRGLKKAEPAIIPSAKPSEPVVAAAASPAQEDHSADLSLAGLATEYASQSSLFSLYNNPAYQAYRDSVGL